VAERKRKKKSLLQERLEFALYRLVLLPVRVSSPRMLERAARVLAKFARRSLKKRDAVARENLALVFPERSAAEREEILDRCWRHFASVVLRFLHGTRKSAAEVTGEAEIVGRQMLDEISAMNRGVILVTAHFGDWERGIALLSLLPAPLTVVARELDNELLDRDLFKARVRAEVAIVDRRRAARALIRTLDQRGTVVLLPDQAAKRREAILAPFLGRDAWTTPAPARLAIRSGAPVLCAFLIPDEGGRLRVELEGPLTVDGSDDAAVAELTRRINDTISAQIRKRPELWLWMHDRWKGVGGGGRTDDV
jgi:KDO2-lipid IV(A) lauroyltransferase